MNEMSKNNLFHFFLSLALIAYFSAAPGFCACEGCHTESKTLVGNHDLTSRGGEACCEATPEQTLTPVQDEDCCETSAESASCACAAHLKPNADTQPVEFVTASTITPERLVLAISSILLVVPFNHYRVFSSPVSETQVLNEAIPLYLAFSQFLI